MALHEPEAEKLLRSIKLPKWVTEHITTGVAEVTKGEEAISKITGRKRRNLGNYERKPRAHTGYNGRIDTTALQYLEGKPYWTAAELYQKGILNKMDTARFKCNGETKAQISWAFTFARYEKFGILKHLGFNDPNSKIGQGLEGKVRAELENSGCANLAGQITDFYHAAAGLLGDPELTMLWLAAQGLYHAAGEGTKKAVYDGRFREAMNSYLNVVNKNRARIMSLNEAFVKPPVIDSVDFMKSKIFR